MNNAAPAPFAWVSALALAALLGSGALACMLPFVALAAVAAATLSPRQALTAVGGIWAVNQAVGFGFLHYPVDLPTLGWGVALLGGTLAALIVARTVLARPGPAALRLPAAFAAAFVAYEVLLYGFAHIAGGTQNFSPAIVGEVLLNDALWFAGLLAVHAALTRVAPATFAQREAAAA